MDGISLVRDVPRVAYGFMVVRGVGRVKHELRSRESLRVCDTSSFVRLTALSLCMISCLLGTRLAIS